MSNSFKKIQKLFFLLMIVFVFIINSNVYAAGEHELGIKAVVCDTERYNNSNQSTNAKNCYNDYKKGLLDSYIKTNGTDIEAGTFVMIVVDYKLGSQAEVGGINAAITYDTNIWEPLLNSSTGKILSLTNKNSLPAGDDWEAPAWDLAMSYDSSTNYIILYLAENNRTFYLDSDVELGYFFMTIKDDAPSGPANIKFSTKSGDVKVTTPQEIP